MQRRAGLLIAGLAAFAALVATGAHWVTYLALGLVVIVAAWPSPGAQSVAVDPPPGTPALRRAELRDAYLGEGRFASDLEVALTEAGIGMVVCDERGTVLSAAGSTGDVMPAVDPSRVKSPALVRFVGEVARTREPRTETMQIGTRDKAMRCVGVFLREGTVGIVLNDVTESERVQAMRTSFVSDASHELKTPIAALRAGAEAIQAALQTDVDRARGFAEQLEEQAVRLADIVDDLLDLSRLEAGPVEVAAFDLADVVAAEVVAARPSAVAANVAIVEESQPVVLLGSSLDVGIAIRNLISNAVRYTPRGGTVDIGLVVEGDEAVVEVIDSGIGIPAPDQARVFERFFRVDNARSRATGGTGLGLSIVRHVMAHHGGTVEVESVSGKGSTFRLRFPMTTE